MHGQLTGGPVLVAVQEEPRLQELEPDSVEKNYLEIPYTEKKLKNGYTGNRLVHVAPFQDQNMY